MALTYIEAFTNIIFIGNKSATLSHSDNFHQIITFAARLKSVIVAQLVIWLNN